MIAVRTFGTVTDAGGSWTGDSNAIGDDGSYAVNSGGTQSLEFSNWSGDSVPVGATIEGIGVFIACNAGNAPLTPEIHSYRLEIGLGASWKSVLGPGSNTLFTSDPLNTAAIPHVAGSHELVGGPSSLFGYSSISVAQANDAAFGIAVTRPSGETDAQRWVDDLYVWIYYSVAGGGGSFPASLDASLRYIPGFGISDLNSPIRKVS